jgi:hypothetical protein
VLAIYLHGFGSGPQSAKATFFRQRLQQVGIPVQVPDLNQDNFAQLTLTRQIQQVSSQLAEMNYPPVTLIGSSLGGLVAAWVAERQPCVQRLVLLAPAFGFLGHWLPRLGAEAVETWQRTGQLMVFHYGEGRPLPLEYGFVADAQRYPDGGVTTACAHPNCARDPRRHHPHSSQSRLCGPSPLGPTGGGGE